MRFENKIAFITGASSGIGRACVERFREEGAQVFAAARREERLVALGTPWAVMDVRDEGQVVSAIARCASELGGIDILINAAGIIGSGGLQDTPREEWDELFATNVDGLYLVTRHALPHLIQRKGAIVNLSSVCGLRPYPGVLAYCMTKAATDMFTQCVAQELAPHGVRVNAVNPGVVVSELHTARGTVADYEAFLERGKQTHPLGRVGRPEEIAALCAFLASEEAGWITGGLHSIDGGRALLSAR